VAEGDVPLNPPQPVYLIHGPELLLREDALAAISQAVLDPELADFNEDRFEAGQCSVPEVIAAAQMLPMMAERRLVVLRDVGKLKGDALKPLAEYLTDPSPSTVLVLEAEKVDMRRAPFPKIKKVGAVVDCKAPYENRLPGWIAARVRQMGRRIEPEAAQFLAGYIGADLSNLAAELEKAAIYAGNGIIDIEAVSETVGAGRVHTVFELTDALGDRRPAAALKALGTLLDAGEAPLKIQAIIVRHYRMLWKASGARGGDLARTLGVPPFLARKLAAQVRRYGDEELSDSFRRFAQVDLDLKGGASSPRRTLEDEILMLSRRRSAPKPVLGEGKTRWV
jgi:DNA polymerase-3 subunit delta